MKYFPVFFVILLLLISSSTSNLEINRVKAKSSVLPQPQPTDTTFKEVKEDINDLIDNLEEKITTEQASKIQLIKQSLKDAKINLKTLRTAAEAGKLSQDFLQELNENFEALSLLEDKRLFTAEDIKQIQDITDDMQIKAYPCDPPVESFEITIYPSIGGEESNEKYQAFYVNAGNTRAQGHPFANGNPVKTVGTVKKGKKYFWLQDSRGNVGRKEIRIISCSEPTAFPLPTP